MKFFLDTANINEIREAAALGILDGVTTNPSLISKEGKPFKETILEICTMSRISCMPSQLMSSMRPRNGLT